VLKMKEGSKRGGKKILRSNEGHPKKRACYNFPAGFYFDKGERGNLKSSQEKGAKITILKERQKMAGLRGGRGLAWGKK